MPKVTTSTLEIAYEEEGPSDGLPIILLHGFPYSPRQFNKARNLLLSLEQRVLIPYLRGYGPTRYLDKSTLRSGQQGVLAKDLLEFMDALKIKQAVLAGYDWGGRAACIVAALHPERVAGLVSCQGYAIQDIATAAVTAGNPVQLRKEWYQYYFNTPQGRFGLTEKRADITKFLWETWSPNWKFSEQELEETVKDFENEDYVETVLHSYRHRYGNVIGDLDAEAWEEKAADLPVISVPTIVLWGKEDGVAPCEEHDSKRDKFTGWYERRVLEGVGHCPPAEAPQAFVDAIMKLVDLSNNAR